MFRFIELRREVLLLVLVIVDGFLELVKCRLGVMEVLGKRTVFILELRALELEDLYLMTVRLARESFLGSNLSELRLGF